ncbi:MAG: hypothetical protein AAF533_16945 [Acidobacteriota bacterium]
MTRGAKIISAALALLLILALASWQGPQQSRVDHCIYCDVERTSKWSLGVLTHRSLQANECSRWVTTVEAEPHAHAWAVRSGRGHSWFNARAWDDPGDKWFHPGAICDERARLSNERASELLTIYHAHLDGVVELHKDGTVDVPALRTATASSLKFLTKQGASK